MEKLAQVGRQLRRVEFYTPVLREEREDGQTRVARAEGFKGARQETMEQIQTMDGVLCPFTVGSAGPWPRKPSWASKLPDTTFWGLLLQLFHSCSLSVSSWVMALPRAVRGRGRCMFPFCWPHIIPRTELGSLRIWEMPKGLQG
jgi:hypothetical protein